MMINSISELYNTDENDIEMFLKENISNERYPLLLTKFYKSLYLIHKKQYTDFEELNTLLKSIYSKLLINKDSIFLNSDIIYDIYYEVIIILENNVCKDILLQLINFYNEYNLIEFYENLDLSKKEQIIELIKNKLEFTFFNALYEKYNSTDENLEDNPIIEQNQDPIPVFKDLSMTDSNYIPEAIQEIFPIDSSELQVEPTSIVTDLPIISKTFKPEDEYTFPNPINPNLPMVDNWEP